MKTIRIVLSLLMFGFLATAGAAELKPGDIVAVPKHTWVTVTNTVSNGNTTFTPKASCSIDQHGATQIIGSSGDLVHAMYLRRSGAAGAECPNGTTFEVSKGVLTQKWVPLLIK